MQLRNQFLASRFSLRFLPSMLQACRWLCEVDRPLPQNRWVPLACKLSIFEILSFQPAHCTFQAKPKFAAHDDYDMTHPQILGWNTAS